MNEKFYKILAEKCKKIDVNLSDEQISQFYKYYKILIDTNKVVNLTAITEMEEVIEKHFVDSLSLIKIGKIENQNIIDIGTGAGFPGIPLKIAFPKIKITLLDSLNKRVNFLNNIILELNLKNIEVIHGRAEDFGNNPQYRELYDISVSRAVSNLSSLSEYCLPFVKEGGYFIAYKSGSSDDEVLEAKGAIFKLSGKVELTEKFTLPDSNVERSLIIIKKSGKMSKKYPRKAGLPTKEPLK
jgi:16S rRNA (guanine(527)-N(7))-methyltransferase GidB